MNPDMFRFTSRPHLERSSFVIGWTKDTGAVSRAAVDYLVKASASRGFCNIEPADFFPVGGVTVEDDVAQFPESRFSYSEQGNLVILRSDEPQTRKYEFLNGVLDLAQHFGKAEALYTVNGIASLIPHTGGRRAFGVFSDPVIQRRLRPHVPADLTWQGVPHTSTYLVWLAKSRRLPAAGLWIEVPFYLADSEDFRSVRAAVALLGGILGRSWNLDEFDQLIADQDEQFAQLREDDPEIDARISNLERGEPLDRQEQLELAEAVHDALKERQRQG